MTGPRVHVRSLRRLELHNFDVNTEAARRQLCGMTHLATGWVCLLPERHRGGCDFNEPAITTAPIKTAPNPAASNAAAPYPAASNPAASNSAMAENSI